MKILVLAYQISPILGSEYSVGWNYVSEMSKDNKLVVLYGASGAHMGDFEHFGANMNDTIESNVRFIAIKPNFFARSINLLNKKGFIIYAFYPAYRIWQKQVYQSVIKLINKEHFDLIHFLNPHGYREPGYLWKVDLPYIWGPIGGIPNRPRQLFNDLNIRVKVLYIIRNWVNRIQFRHSKRLKQALIRTDLLLTASTENQEIIARYYKKASIYLPENGIINSSIRKEFNQFDLHPNDLINFIWIGRIDTNKSLNILLKALANVVGINWHLNVIGEGSKRNEMQHLSSQLHIGEKISWYGNISRAKVLDIFKSAHLHVVTSLGEGNPTTIWEAMANGVPTITLNHCGMKDVICERCGIKINIDSYEQVLNDLRYAIDDLLRNTDKIINLSIGTKECLQKYTWDKRRELFNQFYHLAILNWNRKRIKT